MSHTLTTKKNMKILLDEIASNANRKTMLNNIVVRRREKELIF